MTDLQIVNRALSMIGQIPATSMADTVRPALRAITAYPRCRDEVLRMSPWPSCVRRECMKNVDAMACPWVASTRFEVGYRVTNDTNKTYIATVAGISAAVGGPTGTGSGIIDGAVTWDYVEVSTALVNWCHWPLTDYVVNDLVAWDNRKVYACITAGTTAAATPPTGTSADITDGTVHWRYYCTLPLNRTIYAYQYLYPADCLRVLKVPSLAAVKENELGVQYLREFNCLYCDQDDSYVRYIRREEDPTNWDALLQETVVLRVADEICFDITGQKELAKLVFEKYRMSYGLAHPIALHEGSESTPEDVLWSEV